MAENIDIYDANLTHIGVMERTQAHMEGHWHKTYHCSVISNANHGVILFQVRSPEMVNFPNFLDISAAGHLQAGEKTEDGIREVVEELGISLSDGKLYPLGYRIEVADQKNGQRNREYQSVYIIHTNVLLSEYKPQVEEVTGLLWLKISDGLALFSGSKKKVVTEGIRYNKDSKKWENLTRDVAIEDFLPRIQNYYLTMCIMAERVLENRLPLAIS